MKKKMPKITTYQLTKTALMTAVLCILGPISIPIGPVPISLMTLGLHLTVFVLGMRLSVVSVIVYLILGLVGLPVFAAGGGGIGKLAGPTGGFLVGYILLVLVQGILQKRGMGCAQKEKVTFSVIGMVLGLTSAYLVGTLWFVYQQKTTWFAALSVCVFPFLLGDIAKIAVATAVGPNLQKRLKNAGL